MTPTILGVTTVRDLAHQLSGISHGKHVRIIVKTSRCRICSVENILSCCYQVRSISHLHRVLIQHCAGHLIAFNFKLRSRFRALRLIVIVRLLARLADVKSCSCSTCVLVDVLGAQHGKRKLGGVVGGRLVVELLRKKRNCKGEAERQGGNHLRVEEGPSLCRSVRQDFHGRWSEDLLESSPSQVKLRACEVGEQPSISAFSWSQIRDWL